MTQNPPPGPDRSPASPTGDEPTQAFLPPAQSGYDNRGRGDQGYSDQGYGNQGYGNQGYDNRGYGNQGHDPSTSTAAFDRPADPGRGPWPADSPSAAPYGGSYDRDPADTPDDRDPAAPQPVRRGTLDLGLLLLRIGLGVVLAGHGAQKLFGQFGGSGIDGFEMLLTDAGYDQPTLLAYAGSIAEFGAGVLIVLGLLTPLAGAAALGVMINAWFVSDLSDGGFDFFAASGGQELEMLLVVLAAALILTGPGRYSLDLGRRWATRPFVGSMVALLVGVGSGLAVWFLLNGATPFV